MQFSNPPPLAVIADAHFHDLFGNYGIPGIMADGQSLAIRPFADTVRSTRVFNESGGALRHALDDIAARGIRHVVLLGDYSDDGQATTVSGLRALLDEYSHHHGTRFYATPGNHDLFGPGGRHRSKRFLNAHGGRDLVTSDPDRQPAPDDDSVVVTAGMHCAGYPDGLRALPDLGFFRRPEDILWETPFGEDDDPASRLHEVRSPDGRTVRRLMDASYLVEPFDGVWLIMIDANVFVPLDGSSPDDNAAFADSTNAGWNAMLIHKRFILDWMRDVSARAKKLGKTLIAFSHYPALDPLDNTRSDELAVLGETSLLRRIPELTVADALIDAGIGVHFSGHLHINDTARHQNDTGFLVNVSMPALVAFPPAYKIVRFEPASLTVEAVDIGDMPLDQTIMAQYRAEVGRSGITASHLLEAGSYGKFISEHLGHLVGRRFLRREWPHDLAQAVVDLNLDDLATLALVEQPVSLRALPAALRAAREEPGLENRLAKSAEAAGTNLAALSQIEVMAFLGDWYRVRMGSDLGLDAISPGDLKAYRFLSGLYAQHATNARGSAQASFSGLFRMFDRFISGLPSRNFTIDLKTGDIQPV